MKLTARNPSGEYYGLFKTEFSRTRFDPFSSEPPEPDDHQPIFTVSALETLEGFQQPLQIFMRMKRGYSQHIGLGFIRPRPPLCSNIEETGIDPVRDHTGLCRGLGKVHRQIGRSSL